jgi:holo-[acyl-carrier protein] synthase
LPQAVEALEMIVHVGTDLVSISDVAASIEAYGHRYLERVYSSSELTFCRDVTGEPCAARLAARFAAKEAVIKALRPTEGLALNEIEVTTDASGAPTMAYLGSAFRWVTGLRITSSSVSLSHDGNFAVAVFVAIAL